MRTELVLFSLIVCSCMVLAQAGQNISALSEMFQEARVSAPSPPTEEETAELVLVIRDIEQNVMGNRHILLEMECLDRDTKENTLRYSDENGRVTLNLEPGRWQLTAKVDDLSTSGKDYISNGFDMDFRNSTTVELFVLPAASLRGNVYDDAGRRIVNAKIRVDCGRDYGFGNTSSDEFGCFSLDYVPTGICEVMALSDNWVGSETVNISRGELRTIDITLGHEVKTRPDTAIPLIAAFIVAMVLLFYLPRRGRLRPRVKEVGSIEITDRMQDIIQTLSDREQDVVKLLIENNGRLTQAEIRHFLGIPKATVSRDVYSLEKKKILETIKIGRNKDIMLTGWFLGTEKQS